MNILKRLSNRPPGGDAGDPESTEANSPDEGELPITNYDNLDPRALRPQLSALSQMELAAIEEYELAHQARPPVLNRLRWLKGSEPVPGYDALGTGALVTALSGADAATLKAVREYERHHRDRREIRVEVERALPTAPLSAAEGHARAEQAELVQAGIAGRDKTASGLADRESAPAAADATGLRSAGATETPKAD